MEVKVKPESRKLAIGLCTYKRPQLLRKCLESLFQMNKPEGPELCIIIADNDPEGSGRQIADELNSNNHIPIYYQIEPEKGIPFARNKVLNTAKKHGITELAFIDDDEFADVNWLSSLWYYYTSREVDVVWGWVRTIYPPQTPQWIIEGSFFQLPKNSSGQIYSTAYTNNVLFNFSKLVLEYGLYFDEDCGLVGDDEDFFMRAVKCNAIIHYLADAVVYEILEDKRMTVAYYLKRLFYMKNNKKIFQKQNFKSRLKILRSGFIDIPRSILSLIMSLLTMKKSRFVLGIGFLVSGSAKISGFFGIHIKWN